MIAAWVVYTIAVGALLFAGARALEVAAHALNLATRFIWVVAVAATVALSTRQLIRLSDGLDVSYPSFARRVAERVRSATPGLVDVHPYAPEAARPPAGRVFESLLISGVRRLARTRGAVHGLDVTPLDRWNTTILAGWLLGSAAMLAGLAAAFARLRSIERRLDEEVVDGVPVLLSRDVGPALFGIARPRIVLPRWALQLAPTERRIILAHEREHALARDPATLLGATVSLAIQPWNVALWAMFSRLRLAIEMDCDRRVLGTAADARRYGELLVLVHSRRTFASPPLVAFVEGQSNLEARIRRITKRRPSCRLAAAALTVAGISLAVAAWAPVPSPTRRVAARQNLPKARPLDFVVPSRGTVAPCGIGSRFAEMCSLDGEVIVRVMDSVRVLVGVRGTSSGLATRAEHLFLVTSLDTLSKLLGRSIARGHVEFQDGRLFVLDRSNPDAQMAFGSDPNHQMSDRHPAAVRIAERLVGIAHYAPAPVSIDDVMDLRPCDPIEDGCFTARQRKISFP